MLYKYRAKNAENKMVDGLVDAEAETIAYELLTERGYQILSLDFKRNQLLERIFNFQSVSAKDLVIFSRQLAVMVEADVPLVVGLKSIYEQTQNKRLRKILADITSRVEGGVRLSEALAYYENIFDNFFINLIKTGETSGRLAEVLEYLADQMEKDYDLRKKVFGALTYPIFIVATIFVLLIVMMIYVVPRLTEMLIQSGADLPWSTQTLINMSDFMIVNGWWLLLVAIGGVLSLYLMRKTSFLRGVWGFVKLKTPIFGELLRNTYMIRFTRSLNTLLVGGVPLVEGLGVSRGILDNPIYERILKQAQEEVADGSSLTAALAPHPEIPRLVTQLIETGEETGHLADLLQKISDFYTHEVTNAIDKLMSLLEPIIMIVLGVAVAFVIMSVIMPMYQLATQL